MLYTNLEKTIHKNISESIQDITPGVLVRAYCKGQLICDVAVGATWQYYDLASLTKIIFTQQAMMRAFDAYLWSLDTQVGDLITDFFAPQIKIVSLLTHTSGLDWWKPFYQDLSPSIRQGWHRQRQKLYQLINRPENKVQEEGLRSVYSDIGFMLLGFVLEKLYNKTLLQIWLDLKTDGYSSTDLHFNTADQPLYAASLYAPTEYCAMRKKVLQGQVHDENTWSLGGVSTHAGLFGSIDDIADYGLLVRSQLQGGASQSTTLKTARLFAARAVPQKIGDFALGYMLPSKESPSCSTAFSADSIGHTGFTGTSVWYDQRADFLAVILSNRVHFGRENKGFIGLRPRIHKWLYAAVG
jgi:serine-type D-Ala-D-Ala carboxypeptidase